jgi:peptidoglycan/LPS O-acetylase OafA/YrhL
MLWFFGSELARYFVIWLLGAGLALVPLWLPGRFRLSVSGGLGVVFLAAAAALLKAPLDLYLADIILALTFSALMWSILHATRATAGLAYRRLAQGLANMSYTLYCVHMPVLALVSAWLMPVWQPWQLSLRSAAMLLGVYAGVFVVAWLMWFAFERNTDAIRKRLQAVFN